MGPAKQVLLAQKQAPILGNAPSKGAEERKETTLKINISFSCAMALQNEIEGSLFPM